MAMFQFQYGAIISDYNLPELLPAVRQFQFQYGAIISYFQIQNSYSFQKFQFQYGAIISGISPVYISPSQGFNSNMVRL